MIEELFKSDDMILYALQFMKKKYFDFHFFLLTMNVIQISVENMLFLLVLTRQAKPCMIIKVYISS